MTTTKFIYQTPRNLIIILFSCDGHFLRRSDPASCCGGGDFVPCPDPGGCKQNEEATYGGTAADMNKKGETGLVKICAQ